MAGLPKFSNVDVSKLEVDDDDDKKPGMPTGMGGMPGMGGVRASAYIKIYA